MKELHGDLLSKKYYLEEKNCHYFVVGLGEKIMIDDKHLGELIIEELKEKYGLDQLTFNQRVKEYNRIRKINQIVEQEKLINKYGAVEILKIIYEIQ